jgi:C-terminal processing protease CtpA/Prc
MRTVIVCGVIGLVLGLAVLWWPRASGEGPVVPERSLAAVEEAPMPSRQAEVPGAPVATPHAALTEASEEAPEALVSDPASQDRPTQLMSSGFTRQRALEIIQREAELRREMASHQFAATGTVQPLSASVPSAVEQQLRREMGDAEYEKYLSALGQTTRVRVGDVQSESAAANAGIQSGDEILAYAGRRVFSLGELNALMLQTPEGDTVATTVVRNGQTMQLYVTGGALGISPQGRSRE